MSKRYNVFKITRTENLYEQYAPIEVEIKDVIDYVTLITSLTTYISSMTFFNEICRTLDHQNIKVKFFEEQLLFITMIFIEFQTEEDYVLFKMSLE